MDEGKSVFSTCHSAKLKTRFASVDGGPSAGTPSARRATGQSAKPPADGTEGETSCEETQTHPGSEEETRVGADEGND